MADEITDETIAKQRAAVEAMGRAKSNMETALSRISTLEYALRHCATALADTKRFIGADAYTYGASNGNKLKVYDHIDAQVAEAQRKLG